MLFTIVLACGPAADVRRGDLALTTAPPSTSSTLAMVPAAETVSTVVSREPAPLVARVAADVVAGAFPLVVTLDADASELGSGRVRYEWDLGDGTVATGPDAVHTYLGEGAFPVTLTLVDLATGDESIDTLTVEVERPTCPDPGPVVTWGMVQDPELVEISGLVASRRDPGAWWVHQDSGQLPDLTALDASGATLSTWTLPDLFEDFEDLAAAVDPDTGTPWLFLADFGDNGFQRDEVAIWVAEEPDPRQDGALDPLRMALVYPDGPRNAEALLVDPLTLDLYVVTKDGAAEVYVKRAPHDAEGPFVLEALGAPASLAFTATGGDVSADGAWVAVRDYTSTARLFPRDGYLPLEVAFDAEPCLVPIAEEPQGEAIAFPLDGSGVLTVSEWGGQPLSFVAL